MRQVAKLFLRGRRYTETMRNLTDNQRAMLDDLITTINKMPEMQACKREFGRALGRTIRNEYQDPAAVQADFDIAVMKAAVTILFHQPVDQSTLQDPVQMKKIFSQWVFNYLKQIIRENKIPAVAETRYREVPGDVAVTMKICEVLDRQGTSYEIMEGSETTIMVETDQCDRDTLLALNSQVTDDGLMSDLVDLVKNAKCIVKVLRDRITIKPFEDAMVTVSYSKRTNLKVTSFEIDDGDDDRDSFRNSLEYKIAVNQSPEPPRDLRAAARMMPDDARRIFELMIDPPLDFLEANGMNLQRCHSVRALARYCQLEESEIRLRMNVIKSSLLMAGITP